MTPTLTVALPDDDRVARVQRAVLASVPARLRVIPASADMVAVSGAADYWPEHVRAAVRSSALRGADR